MKKRYWLLPALMLVGSWLYALICEQLPRNHKLLPAAVMLLLFAVTALILNRACDRKIVLLSSAGLLLFSFLLALLDRTQLGPRGLGMALAFLWELLFFPFLSILPLPNIPVFYYLFPALIPFAWTLFCKPSS